MEGDAMGRKALIVRNLLVGILIAVGWMILGYLEAYYIGNPWLIAVTGALWGVFVSGWLYYAGIKSQGTAPQLSPKTVSLLRLIIWVAIISALLILPSLISSLDAPPNDVWGKFKILSQGYTFGFGIGLAIFYTYKLKSAQPQPAPGE